MMKLNIPSKILLGFFICFIIFFLIFFFSLNQIENKIVMNAGKTLAQGVLTSLEKKLMHHPRSSWERIVKANTNNKVNIITISKSRLSPAEQHKLNKGKMVLTTGATYQFLNQVIVAHAAYKKISHSAYALAYPFSDPTQFIRHYFGTTIKFITEDLLSTPINSRHTKINALEKTYSFPLHIYQATNNVLSEKITRALSRNNLTFTTYKHASQIDAIYYAFQGGILKIGPFAPSVIPGRISDILYYFILLFFILFVIFTMLFSWLFVKNMKKIYQLTENFSHGNFNCQTKVNTTSVLYDLYSNIDDMGKKIQQLITSIKNMSRFIAHEIRTPLYTMQLSLDAIKDIKNLPKQTDEYVTSIKEDIKQLNDLVTMFLLYSKSNEFELKIKKEHLNIKIWLDEMIKHHQSSNIVIQLHAIGPESMAAYFDPKLLKHAVDNILVNAMKFAKNSVNITLQLEKDQTIITIDDDGPGIDAQDREIAFTAFATLSESNSFGGHVGLGLAIAKSMIELHSGKILIDQSPLDGCRFVIVIPNISASN